MVFPDSFRLCDESAALVDYWRQAKGEQDMPHRRHMSPLKLRRWVGDISVIHLHDGPKRFFVSLHGANVARHLGPDFNKKYLEDAVPEASLPLSTAPYLESIARKLPTYSIMNPDKDNGLYLRLERMILPFCGDDPACAERALVWVAPDDRDHYAANTPVSEERASTRFKQTALFVIEENGPRRIASMLSTAEQPSGAPAPSIGPGDLRH